MIPNFYDPLPKKTIDIIMTGSNPCASGDELASVLDIIGSDSPYESPGPSVPVFASLVSRDAQAELVIEAWEMFPNPDWEVVKIFAPSAFELESIQIVDAVDPRAGDRRAAGRWPVRARPGGSAPGLNPGPSDDHCTLGGCRSELVRNPGYSGG